MTLLITGRQALAALYLQRALDDLRDRQEAGETLYTANVDPSLNLLPESRQVRRHRERAALKGRLLD